MNELKACPFCGGEQKPDVEGDGNVPYEFCMSKICCSCGATVNRGWNTRPIEDALTARIAELEAENLELRKTLGWAYDLDEYKDEPEVQE